MRREERGAGDVLGKVYGGEGDLLREGEQVGYCARDEGVGDWVISEDGEVDDLCGCRDACLRHLPGHCELSNASAARRGVLGSRRTPSLVAPFAAEKAYDDAVPARSMPVRV